MLELGNEFEYSSFTTASSSHWRDRQAAYLEQLIKKEDNSKHTYVSAAIGGLPLNYACIEDSLSSLLARSAESDFDAGQLIRLLYLVHPTPEQQDLKNLLLRTLDTLLLYPWWPSTPTRFQGEATKNLVFWSENHVLMSLSAAHLSRQFCAIQRAKALATLSGDEPFNSFVAAEIKAVISSTEGAALEESLLRHFLSAHARADFCGVYETLSHVYLPYSLGALFNLYDFSEDQNLRADCSTVIDNIIQSLLLTTNQNGVCTLTASLRAFPRTRQRTTGHNINNLIYLLVGVSPDDAIYSGSQLTDYLTTTRWRPRAQLLDCFSLKGRLHLPQCSHAAGAFDEVYASGDAALTAEELVPFAWSAGLVLHPAFAERTKRYLKSKNMQDNATFSMLKYVPSFLAGALSSSLAHLSLGQTYCGVGLNVYKSGGLVLTSLDRFNPQRAGFQQLPWCCNLGDVGVWSQSGGGAEGVVGFHLTNTHNPCCIQAGTLLLCSYVAPRHGVVSSVLKLGHQSWVCWPRTLFSEAKTFAPPASAAPPRSGFWTFRRGSMEGQSLTLGGAWRVGRRNGCLIGVLCTRPTEECSRPCTDTRVEARVEERLVEVQCSRLICRDEACSWIVVVGVEADFDSIDDFYQQRCLAVEIDEQSLGGRYTCRLTCRIEGELHVDSNEF